MRIESGTSKERRIRVLLVFVACLFFAGWFGYDGWINQDPEMLEHITFNRYGTGVLLVLALFFGWRAYQETQAAKRDGDD